MVLSLAVPFADGALLPDCVMDEIVVGAAALGFRPSEAPRRFRQRALAIAQVGACVCPHHDACHHT
jgi:hypothetical protein